MKLKKQFSKSLPEEPFCEEVGLFQDAVNAILDGSEPWQIADLRATIAMGAFTGDEQRHLELFVAQRTIEKKKEIMRVALTKVLTGNGLEKDLANKVSMLGREEKVSRQQSLEKGLVSQWHQDQMRANRDAFQNAVAQSNTYSGAGGVPLERIENPFSLK